jgi:hypothetical protein
MRGGLTSKAVRETGGESVRGIPGPVWAVFAGAVLCAFTLSARGAVPADPRELRAPVTYAEMEAFLRQADASPHITVAEEGRTTAGRALYLVRLNRSSDPDRTSASQWRVLFIGQQHGDETAGKDALLSMIRQVVGDPARLPNGVDLWIMPMANPDGAETHRRRNGAGADLNRDHLLLAQPETRAIHAVARRVMPHVSVDCHEFARDSADYTDKGWGEWPLIMMDTASNPLLDPAVVQAGERWVEEARPVMERAGFNYTRYFVGDPPPEGELRHSTLDADDARNGIGALGGLSFIIESGVRRGQGGPNADLGERAAAYQTLLWRFVTETGSRAADREAVERARRAPLAPFLPVNTFWGNANTRRVTPVKVIDLATSRTLVIPTANFMRERIVKKSVPTPQAYAVDAAAAPAMRELLARHGVAWRELAAPERITAERCTLVRVEEQEDSVYERYAGRQIVKRGAPAEREFTTGSLVVPLDQPLRVRAALLLEPCMLYGLYQYPDYRRLAAPDGTLPVWRIVAPEGGTR